MRNHEIVIYIILVVLRILLVFFIVRTAQRFAWFLFLPFFVRINLVIEPLLKTEE